MTLKAWQFLMVTAMMAAAIPEKVLGTVEDASSRARSESPATCFDFSGYWLVSCMYTAEGLPTPTEYRTWLSQEDCHSLDFQGHRYLLNGENRTNSRNERESTEMVAKASWLPDGSLEMVGESTTTFHDTPVIITKSVQRTVLIPTSDRSNPSRLNLFKIEYNNTTIRSVENQPADQIASGSGSCSAKRVVR